MLLLLKQQQYKIYKTDHVWLQCRPQRFRLRVMLYKTLKKQKQTKGPKSLADVNIPVPLPSLIPFFGCSFSILVIVAILGFMAASLFVAFVVVLLSVQVPGTVPRLPVSVLTAPMGLIPVVMVTVRDVVVPMFVGVIFLRLHVGRVSALLGFWVKGLLPGEASIRPTAMVVVLGWGGRPVLGFLRWFQAGFLFSLGNRTCRSRSVSPLVTLRALRLKAENTGINQGQSGRHWRITWQLHSHLVPF